jgi:uncharacterized OsmC-like protein
MPDVVARPVVNGIDLAALERTITDFGETLSHAVVQLRVRTTWTGQTRSETMVEACCIGGTEVARRFKVVADQPQELLGANSAPSGQELMLAALNACMVVGYVTQAAVRGIRLTDCRIETDGELDLRGFRVDAAVLPGCRRIGYVVHLEGDGTREQYEEIHEAVTATIVRGFSTASAVQVGARLA